MDQLTCSSILLSTSSNKKHHPPKTFKSSRPSYLDSLYSVHKPIRKQTIKPYTAPFLPTPPKIYNVNASNFKDVVRELTSMPEFQCPLSKRRLKDMAPPPLDLYTLPKPYVCPKPLSENGEIESPLQEFIVSLDSEPTSPPQDEGKMSPPSDIYMSTSFCDLLDHENLNTVTFSSELNGKDCFGAYGSFEIDPMSPLGLVLSPTSLSWCSAVLQSPDTLTAFT